MGFLLMYDISNQESFSAVQDWVTASGRRSCKSISIRGKFDAVFIVFDITKQIATN
ncbi:hypothetical protein JRQ81_003247 [Phrynocephalus forsythii]|uniref:Uncharacterized protein n=1 Tax=Phrynocephalus forsythii TaxID=171643 RepID=A0A9Q1AX98_9SAUR|nr:hypothetical protein JRQ81_003247 [Phrynocephalus forsythii]